MFDEAIRQRSAHRPRLEKEQRSLQRKRQHKGDEIRRLVRRTPDSCGVAAIGSAERPLASITRQLAETESVVRQLDRWLTEIRDELNRLDSETIHKDHLIETLAQFEPLWEVLEHREGVRPGNLLIESIVYDPESAQVALCFHYTPDCASR